MQIIINVEEVKPGVVRVYSNGTVSGTLLEQQTAERLTTAMMAAVQSLPANPQVQRTEVLRGDMGSFAPFLQEWNEFRKVYKPYTPTDILAQFQQAFYAGGLAMFGLSAQIADQALSMDEQAELLGRLKVEVATWLRTHIKDMAEGEATKRN